MVVGDSGNVTRAEHLEFVVGQVARQGKPKAETGGDKGNADSDGKTGKIMQRFVEKGAQGYTFLEESGQDL